MDLIRKFGASVLVTVGRMGVMGLFLVKTVLYTVVPPVKIGRVIKQIHFIGFQSLVVILL
ncbi:MAG TPA: ABC transporter permease, partial [Desulfobacteraceae bacterium]|nr:ABC transporter permease [Desulfobacteraceae bacterium]